MAKASIAVNSGESSGSALSREDAVSLFFETLAAIGMSEKEAAYTMGMDPAQLSRVKSLQARLPWDAMWRLPTRFWLEWRERVDDAKQLTPVSQAALRRQRIVELLDLLLRETA